MELVTGFKNVSYGTTDKNERPPQGLKPLFFGGLLRHG